MKLPARTGCWLFILCLSLPGYAGGPLVVNEGAPVIWQGSSPLVRYRLDQGRLGPLSNSEANALMDDAFQVWEDVGGATIRLQRDSQPLPEDVDDDNFEEITNGLSRGTMAVIYDDDGSIINDVFGSGARNNILGFAGPFFIPGTNSILVARSVFNGFFFERRDLTDNEIFSTVLHEFGHMLGLDHAQFNRHLVLNGLGMDDLFLSIMFPTSSDRVTARLPLAFDDQIALSNLYPNFTQRSSTGRITGTVRRGNRSLPGVNVIARDRSNTTERIATTVTGTFRQNGVFELEGLPPGEYELMIEPVDPGFTRASSVGQYASAPNDLSFDDPVFPEYYNRNDAASEARSLADPVSVRANQLTADIDFVVGSETVDSEEENIRLLAIGSTARAGLAPGRAYSDVFVVHTNGEEDAFEFQFTFDEFIRYEIDLGIENTTGRRSTRTFSGSGTTFAIRIANDGDVAPTSDRYFLGFANESGNETMVTVEVQESAPLPTATPTLTPTPTPLPTATPTPVMLLDADLNRDGMVDRIDFLLFTRDWQHSEDERLADSKLSDDGLPVISPNDLLIWLQQYEQFLEETATD